jgi:hypothetical protein
MEYDLLVEIVHSAGNSCAFSREKDLGPHGATMM